jgi:hypothetical protein
MTARVSLQNMQNVTDPQTTFDWALWLPSIPGGAFSTRDFTFRAQTTSFPGVGSEEFKIEAHGLSFQYPGRRVWEMTLEVTIFETRDAIGRRLIEQWIDFQRDVKTNSGNLSSAYAVEAQLSLYDAPGKITQTLALERFFPLKLNSPSLDNSSAALQYSVTFSYDRSRSLVVEE